MKTTLFNVFDIFHSCDYLCIFVRSLLKLDLQDQYDIKMFLVVISGCFTFTDVIFFP